MLQMGIKLLVMIGLMVLLVMAILTLTPWMGTGMDAMRQMNSGNHSGGASVVQVMRLGWDSSIGTSLGPASGLPFNTFLLFLGAIPVMLGIWLIVRLAQRFLG